MSDETAALQSTFFIVQ